MSGKINIYFTKYLLYKSLLYWKFKMFSWYQRKQPQCWALFVICRNIESNILSQDLFQIDSIAVLIFEYILLELTNTVWKAKIWITLLIGRRGDLSNSRWNLSSNILTSCSGFLAKIPLLIIFCFPSSSWTPPCSVSHPSWKCVLLPRLWAISIWSNFKTLLESNLAKTASICSLLKLLDTWY